MANVRHSLRKFWADYATKTFKVGDIVTFKSKIEQKRLGSAKVLKIEEDRLRLQFTNEVRTLCAGFFEKDEQ